MKLSFTADQMAWGRSVEIIEDGIYLSTAGASDNLQLSVSSNIEWSVEFVSSAGNSLKLNAGYDNTGAKFIDVMYEGTRTALHSHKVIGRLMAELVPTARLVTCESTNPEVPWYTTKAIEEGLALPPQERNWNQFSYWRNLVKEVKE